MLETKAVIERVLVVSKNKYNELQRRLSYLNSGNAYPITASSITQEKAVLGTALTQLNNLIGKLSNPGNNTAFIREFVKRYRNLASTNCEKVVLKVVPDVVTANKLTKEVEQSFGKFAKSDFNQYQMPKPDLAGLHSKIVNTSELNDLLNGKEAIKQNLNVYDYDSNQQLQGEYALLIDKVITTAMTDSRNRDVAAPRTPSGVQSLIDTNHYFDVLHGMSTAQIEKHQGFITAGFDTMFEQWSQTLAASTNDADKQKSYQTLMRIFDNFKGYVSAENVKTLQTNVKALENQLRAATHNYDAKQPESARQL